MYCELMWDYKNVCYFLLGFVLQIIFSVSAVLVIRYLLRLQVFARVVRNIRDVTRPCRRSYASMDHAETSRYRATRRMFAQYSHHPSPSPLFSSSPLPPASLLLCFSHPFPPLMAPHNTSVPALIKCWRIIPHNAPSWQFWHIHCWTGKNNR